MESHNLGGRGRTAIKVGVGMGNCSKKKNVGLLGENLRLRKERSQRIGRRERDYAVGATCTISRQGSAIEAKQAGE